MRLEDYFDFLSEDDIRLKGHRIGIDDVLWYYLEGYTPEEIVVNLPTLTLEEVHATITYYLHNRATINAYLKRLAAWRDARYEAAQMEPSPLVERLRAYKESQVQRQAIAA